MLTASEAVQEYRELFEVINWDKRMLGVFVQGNLLIGRYDHTLKDWLVDRNSMDKLIEYVQRKYQNAFENHGKRKSA